MAKYFFSWITCEASHESERCHLGSFFLGGGGWSRHIVIDMILKFTTRKQLILFVSVSMNSQSLQMVGTAWWPKVAPKSS